MITKDDIATYRATYPREYWERKAKELGFNCSSPLGAVFAVNALCDAYEEIEKQRDELLVALKTIYNHRPFGKNGTEYALTVEDVARNAIASVKGNAA